MTAGAVTWWLYTAFAWWLEGLTYPAVSVRGGASVGVILLAALVIGTVNHRLAGGGGR